MKLIFPEVVKRYVELQTNSAFEMYYKDPVMDLMYNYIKDIHPNNVLDLGSGIGRASVNFFKKFNWKFTKFYLLDGNSGNKQVAGLNPSSNNDFYNSVKSVKHYCEANGLTNYELINIEKDVIPAVKFDLVYSLACIGFHWHFNIYLENLISHTDSGSLLLFQLRNKSEWIKESINYIKSLGAYEVVSVDNDKINKNLKIMVLRRS